MNWCNVNLFQPLGAVDYIAISKEYDTVLVESIPILTPRRKAELRRFIIMIDNFYDNKVKSLHFRGVFKNALACSKI